MRKTLPWRLAAGLLFPAAAISAPGDAPPAPARAARRKKLIASGWDKADSERLRKNLRLMEQRLFDGVVVTIRGRIDATKRCPMRRTFIDEPWRREWFAPCIANLKA